MKRILTSIFVVSVLGGLIGCSAEHSPMAPDGGGAGGNSPTSARLTVSWAYSSLQPGTGSSVTVTLQPSGSSQTVTSGSRVVFSDLTPGTYHAHVTVHDDAGLLIQQGDSDAFVLSAGDDHTVRLNVTPLLPPAPTGVKAARTRLRPWISVTWSEASGAENYRVYRSESVDGKYQMIGDSDRPSFIDKNALRAKYYYYRVASMNAAGTSAKSKTYGSCYLKGWRFEHETVANTANGIGVRYDLLAWGYLGKPRAACVYGIFAKDGTYYYTPGSGFDGKAAFKTVYLPIHELSMWKGGGLVVYDTTFDSNYRNNQYTQYVAVKVFTSADPQKITDSSYCETRMFRFTWSVNKNGDPVMLPGDEVAADEAAVIEASLSGHEDASHEAGQVNVGTCSNGAEDVNVEAP